MARTKERTLGPEEDARVPRCRRGSWPSARRSLVEVGQIEELEAPVALDRAVDEDHVVHCGAGPVSATGPATAPSRPAPAQRPIAPPGTNKKKPGTKKMALETPVGADAGRVRAGRRGAGRRVTAWASLTFCGKKARRMLSAGRWGLPKDRPPPPPPHKRGVSERHLPRREGALTWRGSHLQSHADQDQHCTQMKPRA